ncbi:MAG: 3-hydroxyacyl-CoA dehydrogenase family protein, partial [Pseudomonadota bacterium]
AGHEVTTVERDAEAAASARQTVSGLVDGALRRGKIDTAERDARTARHAAVDDMGAAAHADLAVEAVFEDPEVKQQVFARLADVVDPQTLLATNTSYLDPRVIFQGIAGPARCLGLHFFSPAHIMRLVEVVRLPDTSTDALAAAFKFTRGLGKQPVLSGICEGFIGNRILSAVRREAEYLLADGALPYEVDAAMRAEGMAMGPFEVQDMAGLQIAWATRTRQAATRPPEERYEAISDQLCEAGWLGRRAGRGWYRYADGASSGERDPDVEALILAHSAVRGITRRPIAPAEISKRLLAVMANEGARIVEEGIAQSDGDVDVVKVSGYGFPRWRGGPMFQATKRGWATVGETMRRVAEASPNSWQLARRLRGEVA